MDNLIIIKTLMYRHEAEVAKGLLSEQGIESIIQVDDCGGTRAHLSLGMGGAQLLVKESDRERVEKVLKFLENK